MKLVDRIKSAIKTRNNFSLSYDGVMTCDWGDIVPICVKEMVPTDRFTVNGQVFMRLAQLAAPTFGRIHGFVNHFFVPYRILMPEYAFEDSITGGTDGTAPEQFPFITYRALYLLAVDMGVNWGILYQKKFLKLLSYFGLGHLASDLYLAIIDEDEDMTATFDDEKNNDEEHSISLLPFLALARIYGDYYFPYGLEDDDIVRQALHRKYEGLYTVDRLTDEGLFLYLEYALLIVTACYTKDYFTSAFTRPQRGDASIVPVSLSQESFDAAGDIQGGEGNLYVDSQGDELGVRNDDESAAIKNNIIGQFEAHAMKWASNIQAFLERNNIAGGRYLEQMLARFGVKLKAEELQRSQYLGGSDFWTSVSDVTRTSSSSNATSVQEGLGSQAGKGIGLGKHSVSYTSQEYGLFITLFHVVPETGFVDGLDRMWTRRTKFDYWQPETEENGNRPIYNKELNGRLAYRDVSDNTLHPNGVFGYAPQDSEYKFSNPILAGDYVLGNGVYTPTLMNAYHLYRRIQDSDTPVLNVDFVRICPSDDDPESAPQNFNRIYQNTNSRFDHFLINTQISIGANRPMIGFAEAGLEFANDNGGSGSVNVPYGGIRL